MHEGTVIDRPRTQLIIERPRLTRLLDEAGARIMLLLAPAGYGKTTLAQQWTRRQERVGWYLGGRGMVDVAGLSVGIADVLALMGEPARVDMLERVRILASRGHDARGLAKAVSVGAPGGDWLLVVDDYHHAHGAADAEAFFEELVALTEVRLLITSRERPSWLPARSVVYGEAAVIEMDALAFTDDEALAVLGGGGERIVAEARGWPAVIGLAAMRGGGGSDVAAGLAPEELYRFFAEDLFSSASQELREAMYLLALAGVDGAKALLGAAHAELLGAAAERGFLAGEGKVVHPLLRGFLLAKIAELEEAKIRSLVEQAVGYLADAHRWDECLFVLEQFPDDGLILTHVERGLTEMVATGLSFSVRDWLLFARRRRLDGPLLLLAEAEVALRERDDHRAEAFGERAGRLLGGPLAARAYLTAARAAHLRSSPDVRRLIDAALTVPGAPEPVRNEALWTLFNAARERPDSDALAILGRLQESPSTNPSHELRVLSAKGVVLCDAGRVSESIEALELAAACVSEAHDPFARTSALHYLGYAYLMAARYGDVLVSTTAQIEDARDTGLAFVVDHALLRKAGALIGLRRFSDASRSIEELRSRDREISSFIRDNLTLLEVKLAIGIGDLPKAQALLKRAATSTNRPPFQGEVAAYSALVAGAIGDASTARAALAIQPSFFAFLEAGALRALAHAVLAVRRGFPRGFSAVVLTHLLERGVADPVVTSVRAFPALAEAATTERSSAQSRLAAVLRLSGDVDIARRAGLQLPREARPRGQLSRRERDVYELLAQGRSNGDIARILFISESTAKVHVRHIFEKLGVRTRAEAARLAGEIDRD